MENLSNVSSLFLLPEEVIELTGRKQRQKQLQQLTNMDIKFTIDALGRPKVLRKAVEMLLAGDSTWQSNQTKTNLKESELNLD